MMFLETENGAGTPFGCPLKKLLKEGSACGMSTPNVPPLPNSRALTSRTRSRGRRSTRRFAAGRLVDRQTSDCWTSSAPNHAKGNLLAVPGGPADRADEHTSERGFRFAVIQQMFRSARIASVGARGSFEAFAVWIKTRCVRARGLVEDW